MKLKTQTANEVKAQQNIDLHDNKNDNVFIVKPSYLRNKWRHLFRVPTYHEWQTSNVQDLAFGILEDLM